MEEKEVGNFLKEHGIKPSIQRIKIYHYLLQNKTHPTVDKIFQDLVDYIPTLSKTTVYNTLNTFVESHLVHEIIIEDNEVRYDIADGTHGHFKCKKCGKIVDFDLNIDEIDLPELDDVIIDETHFYLKGYCKDCKK